MTEKYNWDILLKDYTIEKTVIYFSSAIRYDLEKDFKTTVITENFGEVIFSLVHIELEFLRFLPTDDKLALIAYFEKRASDKTKEIQDGIKRDAILAHNKLIELGVLTDD
jgi:hypothetical protein